MKFCRVSRFVLILLYYCACVCLNSWQARNPHCSDNWSAPSCLFDEQMDPPGKFMSVRGTNGPTILGNYKKVALRKKEQIFSKTVSVAASESILLFIYFHFYKVFFNICEIRLITSCK